MTSPYGIYGKRLVERGFCAIPCMPGDKIPADFHDGEWKPMASWTSKYSGNPPSSWQINSWSDKPDGGICLVLGRASQYVVAIDVDVDEAVDDVRRCLPHTDVVKRGQKGATFFFRSRTIPSTSFNGTKPDGRIVRLVDVLAEGKQTVLPPSIHPKTGLAYEWTGGYALDEIEPSDLPELPENTLELLREVLRDHGYNEDAMPHSHLLNKAAKAGDPRYQNYSDSAPYKQLNDEAWANPEKWLCALPLFKLQRTRSGNYECVGIWAQSGKGQADEARERNLKINVHKHTIVDFGDGDRGYSPIDLVAAARKCTPAEGFRYLSDILAGFVKVDTSRLRLSKEPEQPEPEPKAVTTVELPPVKAEVDLPRKPLMDITKCPGLIGRMADHITLTAKKQQPLFSMGAALAVMGVLTGRLYQGPTGLGTSLYQIMAAGTGKGKQHPFDGARAILSKCGLIGHLGPGEFASDVAIFSALHRQPNLLCCIDEAAGIMGRSSARNAASHETGMSGEMRKIYSLNFKVYMTKESAARPAFPIYWPALGLFMGSTAEELYSKITSAEISNGLLNRFVILRNDERPARSKNYSSVSDVPPDIIEECKNIYFRNGTESGPFHGDGATDPSAKPVQVEFADDEAELLWEEIDMRGESLTDEKSPLYVRAAENALRVATCRAISNDWRNPAITAEDLAWAAQYVFTAADMMLIDTRDKMAENPFEADMNKVIGILKRNKGEATRSLLARHARMAPKRLDEVASALAEGGRIEMIEYPSDARGRPPRVYKLVD